MKPLVSEQVISYDGTAIAYQRLGTGSPLILVHGAGAANALAWTGIIPTLARHFTVYAIDRRGHGRSGDGPDYALEWEFGDLAALVEALGGPVDVLGHSLGGLCALEAALLTPHIHRLVLYEPMSLPLDGQTVYPPGFITRLQALLETGDREGVLTTFYREIAGLSLPEIEAIRSSPIWPARLATAHTLPRELGADERYQFSPGRFQELQTPTLLLEGGDSRDFEKAGNAALAAALPDCRIAVLPGQQHIAMYTAPDLFLKAVLGFLLHIEAAG